MNTLQYKLSSKIAIMRAVWIQNCTFFTFDIFIIFSHSWVFEL